MLTDPVADMLTRIRNANKAMHETTSMPHSRLKEGIAELMKAEGYIKDYKVDRTGHPVLVIELKYGRNRERIITDIKRVSKPGRRVYKGRGDLPRVMGGLGIAIVSTSAGVMTDRNASKKGIGGEVLAYVW